MLDPHHPQPQFTFHGDCHTPSISLVLVLLHHRVDGQGLIQVTKTGQLKNGLKSSASARIPLQFHPNHVYHAPLRKAIEAKGWHPEDCHIHVWCHEPLDTSEDFEMLSLREIQLVAVAAARKSHHRLFEHGHDMVPFRSNATAPQSLIADYVWPLSQSFLNFSYSVL